VIRAAALPSPSKEPFSAPAAEHLDHLLDASLFPGKADRLYFPETEEEASWVLRKARAERTPVTLSGAGTGLTGGRVPQGGIILCTERMKQLLRVDWDGGQGRRLFRPQGSLKAIRRMRCRYRRLPRKS